MDRKRKYVFIVCGILCLVAALLSISLGAARLSLLELWRAILGGPNDTAGRIFWYSRLPRTCACILSGAALAAAGCILQSLLGNKLASPGIIGVNAGAGLAVTLCCAFGSISGWTISIASFAGAMLAALTVMLLARKTGASRTTVILAGVAMNSILHALRDAVTSLIPNTASLSGEFRVGGFSSVVTARLIPAGILIVLALAVALTLANDLDVLTLGEDTAQSLGMTVKRIRLLFLLLAALLAGAAVSFTGLLGFVGLLVPHISRRLVGGESRHLLPMSILTGSGFVTVCDVIARLLFAPHELYAQVIPVVGSC